jgi:hypothetical protein
MRQRNVRRKAFSRNAANQIKSFVLGLSWRTSVGLAREDTPRYRAATGNGQLKRQKLESRIKIWAEAKLLQGSIDGRDSTATDSQSSFFQGGAFPRSGRISCDQRALRHEDHMMMMVMRMAVIIIIVVLVAIIWIPGVVKTRMITFVGMSAG